MEIIESLPEKIGLSEPVVRAIDDILFLPESKRQGGQMFVFGNIAFLPAFRAKVGELVKKFAFTHIILTGGLNRDYRDEDLEETRLVKILAASNGLDWTQDVLHGAESLVMYREVRKITRRCDVEVRAECESSNTLENVMNAVEFRCIVPGLPVSLVATAEHMLRALRTFETHAPMSGDVSIAPYYASIPLMDAYAAPGRWPWNELARGHVLGALRGFVKHANARQYKPKESDLVKFRSLSALLSGQRS